jgi:uncharacterized protein involved in outer membrane biogenesis
MHLKAILIAIAGAILVIMVGAVVALRSIDVNKHKGLIAARVEAATGRQLRIDGNLNLKIGFFPAVVVEDVSLANAPWGSRPDMLKARRLEVELALLPLIFREIQVKRLILVQPDILLETNATGVGNWSLGGVAAPAAPLAAKPGGAKPALASLAVGRLSIEKGTLTYRDGRTKRTTSLAFDRLNLQTEDATGPMAIDLAATYNGKPLTLAGTVGALGELEAPSRPYPVKLSLKAGGATAEVDGTIAKPMSLAGLDIKVAAKGQDLSEVASLASKRVPALGPFTVTARVTGSPQGLVVSDIDASIGMAEQVLVKATGEVKDALNAKGVHVTVAVESKNLRSAAKVFGLDLPPLLPLSTAVRVRDVQGAYAFDDLRADIGRNNLAGSGAISIGGSRPKVKAQLASTLLDLAELFPKAGESQSGTARSKGVPESRKDKRIFPANPWPLGDLKVADVDLDLKVDRLVLPNKLSLETLAAHLLLSNGRLEIQPLSTRINSGTLTGRVDLDASAGKAPVVAAKIDAKAVDLGQTLKQMGHPDLVTGTKTDLAMDLRGRGGSVRDLMAGLNGDVLLVMGEGKIHPKFVEWLGADLLTQVAERVNPFRKTDPYTELKCGVVRFAAKDGIASTDKGIAFETSRMTLVSSGTVDLKTEAIDFSLHPDTRQVAGVGAGELAKLLRVRGTLAEPSFGIDELEAAKTAASIGAAVATSGLSFLGERLAKLMMADRRPCETALGRTPARPRTSAGAAGRAPAGKESPSTGSGIGQVIRGLFGK